MRPARGTVLQESLTMNEPAIREASANQRWPMTGDRVEVIAPAGPRVITVLWAE